MKKKVFVFMVVVLAAALFTACSQSSSVEHTDPSFLIATWEHSVKGTEFTINPDYTFELEVIVPDLIDPVGNPMFSIDVTGDIVVDDSGPNNYFIKDMVTTHTGYKPILAGLSVAPGISVIITPAEDKKSFTFEAGEPAGSFFGGTYTKIVP